MSTAAAEHAPRRVPAYNPWLAALLLLLLGSLWGLTFSLSKLAIASGVPPLGYTFWQCAGPALALGAILLARRERLPVSPRHLRFYLLCGTVGLLLPNVNFFLIIAHIPAGLMAVVMTTGPIITFVLALSCGLERFRWLRIGGLLLGFAGAAMLVLSRNVVPAGALVFLLLAFLTPFFYACSNVLTAKLRPPEGSAQACAFGMLASAAVMVLPLMLATGHAYMPWPPFGIGEWAMLVQVVSTTITYIGMFYLIQLAGPVYFSQVSYLVTLAGIFWGVVFFDEVLSAWVYRASAVILAGVAMVNLGRR